ncbi:MAG: imidazole glycerol phosphate synthase subunit HisH [Bacillota bacterium]|nr:imidazole glycerol phosphate synthase subunit HisH [Bacillota bacterium]
MGYIAIVDYGAGNLLSVSKAFGYLGIETKITNDSSEIERADAVVLPGVGAFPDAMEMLKAENLIELLKKEAVKKPFLGICLGMQMLFDKSTEIKETTGLSLIPGEVTKIKTQYKLPQTGWNSLKLVNPSQLTKNLPENAYVYFVHSFSANVKNRENLAAVCYYGTEVTALIQKDAIFGCQFHPEKSGETGLMMLKNFGELI